MCDRPNWLTNCMTDLHWLIDWLTGWLANQLADWLTAWPMGWRSYLLTDLCHLIDWLIDWHTDWPNKWLIKWHLRRSVKRLFVYRVRQEKTHPNHVVFPEISLDGGYWFFSYLLVIVDKCNYLCCRMIHGLNDRQVGSTEPSSICAPSYENWTRFGSC